MKKRKHEIDFENFENSFKYSFKPKFLINRNENIYINKVMSFNFYK